MAWLRTSISALLAAGLALGLFCLVLGQPRVARAEPVLVSVEGAAGLALTAPQSDRFGIGAMASLGVAFPLAPALSIGAKLRAGFLTDGQPPLAAGLADPGLGSLETASLMLRLRPFAAGQGVRRATGLFVEAGAGGAVTGELGRASFEGGVGYGLALGSTALAPVLRYVQVVQPASPLSSADARLLTLGVELTFFDARPALAKSEAPTATQEPPDRDEDGIADAYDKCPHAPEDLDGHADADGCPEFDNDTDRILDDKDKCPDAAEDYDEYEDSDGCPELDNDGDGFADTDDSCPAEAEIVNGNKDYDGCPDEGLFEFKNDRIVLEERVLFDFARARVKREARPILRAIVALKAQHPEWIKLRIEGHADLQGDAKFNQELSERRANNVLRELVSYGIPATQIESVGYGSTRPRDKRSESEGNARNRRVEFVVVARGVAAPGTTTTLKPDAEAPSDEQEIEDKPAKDDKAERKAEQEHAP